MTAPVTLAYVKKHLNIRADVDDDELQTVVDAAVILIEELIGPISPVTVTETYDGGARQIVLRTFPVQSVGAVTESVGGSIYTVGTYQMDDGYLLTKVTSSAGEVLGFGFDNQFGSPDSQVPFTPGKRNVSVTYTAGRSVVSAKLQYAIAEQVRHMWKTQQGSRSRQTDDGSQVSLYAPTVLEALGADLKPPVVG